MPGRRKLLASLSCSHVFRPSGSWNSRQSKLSRATINTKSWHAANLFPYSRQTISICQLESFGIIQLPAGSTDAAPEYRERPVPDRPSRRTRSDVCSQECAASSPTADVLGRIGTITHVDEINQFKQPGLPLSARKRQSTSYWAMITHLWQREPGRWRLISCLVQQPRRRFGISTY